MKQELYALHADLEQQHWWFTGRRQIMRRLIESVLPPGNGSTVVDVGCGTGSNIASLSDAYRCVGADTSTDAIALARQRFPAVDFRLGLAPEILGDVAAQADLFLMMDVLEHIEDDYLALSSLLAAAKPGALFYLTVPANMALWSQHDVSFGHYRRYDAERFERIWKGLPASTVLLSHYCARLYPVIRTIRVISELRHKPFGDNDTDLRLPGARVNEALRGIFAGESKRLQAVMRGTARPYPFGSSLVAIVRRESGAIQRRMKPAGER
jgi:SAM-dependent methyltransferase